jgi:endogenous inhibitor of DNA gyrase (YacG/DUF329 family)
MICECPYCGESIEIDFLILNNDEVTCPMCGKDAVVEIEEVVELFPLEDE